MEHVASSGEFFANDDGFMTNDAGLLFVAVVFVLVFVVIFIVLD